MKKKASTLSGFALVLASNYRDGNARLVCINQINHNSHRPNISSVISGYKQPSKSAQSIEITGFIEKSKPSQIIFLYTLLPLTA